MRVLIKLPLTDLMLSQYGQKSIIELLAFNEILATYLRLFDEWLFRRPVSIVYLLRSLLLSDIKLLFRVNNMRPQIDSMSMLEADTISPLFKISNLDSIDFIVNEKLFQVFG